MIKNLLYRDIKYLLLDACELMKIDHYIQSDIFEHNRNFLVNDVESQGNEKVKFAVSCFVNEKLSLMFLRM